jgi:hypothetical protein
MKLPPEFDEDETGDGAMMVVAIVLSSVMMIALATGAVAWLIF